MKRSSNSGNLCKLSQQDKLKKFNIDKFFLRICEHFEHRHCFQKKNGGFNKPNQRAQRKLQLQYATGSIK